MKIHCDRYYHQFFVLPSIGITYGRPNSGYMFAVCLNWLCFGLIIGFKKAKPGIYDWRL
jgi:hypothetical protein